MPPRSRRAPRGFVLPTSMLVITLLTVLLAAAFILVSADYRTTDNAFASARSLALAQAGLQDYFSAGHNLLGQSQDSTRFAFGNGYAVVVARKLRDSVSVTMPSLWVVRSTGYDTVRALSGQPNGQRTVAQFATYQSGMLPARAALVAANGVQMLGNSDGSNPLSGYHTNYAPSTYNPSCTAPAAHDTTALTVAAGDYNSGGTGGVDPARGIEYLASQGAVRDSTHIDWARLLAGEFTPDFLGALPPAGNNTYYSYYFTGDVTIPSGQRRGLLVAAGDVILADNAHWDGVIVAGGRLDANVNGNYWIHGMVITGLNAGHQATQIKRVWPLGTAVRVIQWDWCYAHASIASLSFLVPLRNAWVDTWSAF